MTITAEETRTNGAAAVEKATKKTIIVFSGEWTACSQPLSSPTLQRRWKTR